MSHVLWKHMIMIMLDYIVKRQQHMKFSQLSQFKNKTQIYSSNNSGKADPRAANRGVTQAVPSLRLNEDWRILRLEMLLLTRTKVLEEFTLSKQSPSHIITSEMSEHFPCGTFLMDLITNTFSGLSWERQVMVWIAVFQLSSAEGILKLFHRFIFVLKGK